MSEVSKIIPSLEVEEDDDVLVRKAIDNLRFIGDVRDTKLHILERVLSHCTIDQLMHIEKCSKGRDLTPVTNNLWKSFYERKFGKDDANFVIERMQRSKKDSLFRWKDLYEAKMKALEKKAVEIEERMVRLFQKEKARKQSHQVQFSGASSSSSGKQQNCHRRVKFSSKTLEVSESGSNKKRSFETTNGNEAKVSSDKKRSFERTKTGRGNIDKKSLFKKAKREAS